VDVSQNPDFLKDKRGIIDGREFFSKSPFSSNHFLIATATNLVCLVIVLAITLRHSGRVSSSTAWLLITVSLLVLISWFGSLQHIRRIRTLYKEGLINNVEAGSSMDIALGVAAGAIFDWLAGISCTVFIALLYVWVNY
jgi:hypothetical protein